MTSSRRVVITGIGAITPLGQSLSATMAALGAGRSAIGPATVFDARGFACCDAAEIRDWDPRPSFRVPKALKLADRPARFAVAAAEMALTAARWPRQPSTLEQLGVAIGSSGSDLQASDIGRALARDPKGESADDIGRFADRILSGLNPLWLLISLPNMTSAHVAIQLQASGPNTTIMSDWAAGHQAIGEGAGWIRADEATAVLAGGADSGLQPFVYAAYEQAGLFTGFAGGDARDRFVPGEGAALFLLEERDAALARGATVHAELCGYAARPGCADDGSALARTLADAMAEAGWQPGDVTVCGVAAPRTPAYTDPVRRAVASVIGDDRPPLDYSTRLGHGLAAAGPIDAALFIASRESTSSPPGRILTSAIGCSGEAVTLAIETTGPTS